MFINHQSPTPGIINPEVALIEEILIRRAINMDDERMEAITQLLKVATGANFYACQNDHAINSLWQELRAQPAAFSLFMDVVTEFIVRMGGHTNSELIACVTAWASVYTHAIHPSGYADETLKDRVFLKDDKQTAELLMNNLWLVVLGVISQANILNVVQQVVEQRDQLNRWRIAGTASK